MVSSLLVVGAIGGLGAAAVGRWAPGWGGSVVVYTAAVNLAACWLAFLPVAAVMNRKRDLLPRAVLAATMMRLALVGIAAMAALASGWWNKKVLAVWLVAFYLALLAVETGWAVRLLRRGTEKTDGSVRT